MKESDFKHLEKIEGIIDAHHEGLVDATEALEDIAKFCHPFRPDNGMRAEKGAFLLGQMMGALWEIARNCQIEPVCTELSILHQEMRQGVEQLYYSHLVTE